MNTELISRVNAKIALCYDIGETQIAHSANLLEDLGDSLDAMQLAMELQDEFGITISNDELREVQSVTDLYALIQRKTQDVGAAADVVLSQEPLRARSAWLRFASREAELIATSPLFQQLSSLTGVSTAAISGAIATTVADERIAHVTTVPTEASPSSSRGAFVFLLTVSALHVIQLKQRALSFSRLKLGTFDLHVVVDVDPTGDPDQVRIQLQSTHQIAPLDFGFRTEEGVRGALEFIRKHNAFASGPAYAKD